jgi:hypothetical protein
MKNNFEKKSSRHHYIPKFLIEGFTNEQGLLYVYDKQKDEILKKPKAPKSIFFEWDRNTLDLNQGKQSTFLEEEFYSKIDNDFGKAVKYFQDNTLSEIKITEENTAQFLFFLITLFWRIPATDYAMKDLIDRSEIVAENIDVDTLRQDPAFYKLEKSRIFSHMIDQMRKYGKNKRKYINIHQNNKGCLVIGDNPLLFRETSTKFSEFAETDFLIAITSNRIYSSTTKELRNFGLKNRLKYNVSVINQSRNYVCCNNREVLEKSVELYREFTNKGIILFTAENTFMTE